MRKRFRTRILPLICLAFSTGWVYGEALFPERFEYAFGDLTLASSNFLTPTISDAVNPDFHVAEGQPTWDYTGQMVVPENNGNFGTGLASSGIKSGSEFRDVKHLP